MTSEPIVTPVDETITQDYMLDKRVRLKQHKGGYRAGLDAALLAASVAPAAGARVLDVGAGVGAVSLALAWRHPSLKITAFERDEKALSLLHQNITDNGFDERVTACAGDVGQGFAATGLERFDVVLSNPPYFSDDRQHRLPAEAKRGAYFSELGLEAWIKFLLAAAKSGGTIAVIHRAEVLGDIFASLGKSVGDLRILPVSSRDGQAANRVLVLAKKHRRTPMKIFSGFVIHQNGKKFYPDVEKILRGNADLVQKIS